MRTVDPKALLNEIQERLSQARLLIHVAEADGPSEEIAEAGGVAIAWREAVPEVPQGAADQLAAAGAIIAALVRQLDSYGAIVPHLPNVSPGQQSAAMRMLAGVGLDCNGRRVA